MDWTTIAQLIITVGLPLAERIWQKSLSGTPPTQADFDEFRATAKQTALDRAKVKLLEAGIPLDSDKAKEILSLVS